MFKTTRNKGFHVTVNGFTLSVQFGTGNYCERRDYDAHWDAERTVPVVESKDAEIAIWRQNGDNDGSLLPISEYDTVRGGVSALTVARIMGFLATVKAGDNDAVIAFVRSLEEPKGPAARDEGPPDSSIHD